MKKNKTTRRSIQKYPALDPAYNLKSRRDLIEVDYLHVLNEEEKEWLNKFNEEYVNASFNKQDISKNLHNTEELIKDCEDSNNKRNNDLLVTMKTNKRLDYFSDKELERKEINYEDYLIYLVDIKK